MTQRPHIICHMTSSIDGGLHPSRYTDSPDGKVKDWSGVYERAHDEFGAKGWIVGRVTMAEMAKGKPHPPEKAENVERPYHFPVIDASSFAIALDRSGKLHFSRPDIDGDHVVVLLGSEVDDAHLAERAGVGISYIVSETPEIDLVGTLKVLRRDLGIETLLLEGGAGINGSFLAAGLVDELSVIVTPTLDGGDDAQRIAAGGDGLKGAVELSLTGCEQLDGGTVHLRYSVNAVAPPG